LRQQAALVELLGPGDDFADRDGIEPGPVDHLRAFVGQLQIRVTGAHGESGQGLEFRSLRPALFTVETPGDHIVATAGRDTTEAPLALHVVLGRSLLPGNPHPALVHPGLEVTIRQDAHGLLQPDQIGGAGDATLLVVGVVIQRTIEVVDQALELLRLCHPYTTGTRQRHRFQVLGCHERTHTRAAHGTSIVGHDAGVADAVHGGGSTTGHLHGMVVKLTTQSGLCLPRIQVPQMRSVANLHLMINDAQIDRFVGPAFDNDLIEAGVFHFRAEVTAGVGVSQVAGVRRFAAGIDT